MNRRTMLGTLVGALAALKVVPYGMNLAPQNRTVFMNGFSETPNDGFPKENYKGYQLDWTGWKASQENTMMKAQYIARRSVGIDSLVAQAIPVEQDATEEARGRSQAETLQVVKRMVDLFGGVTRQSVRDGARQWKNAGRYAGSKI